MKRLFTVLAVAAIGGCSIFGWDDFTSDPPAAADDAGGTGTNDAATSETGSPPGPGDAGPDGGPSGPFCKTLGASASLCDDFEEPGTFTGKWPEQDSYLGTLEIKDGIGFASSRGLHLSATPIAGGGSARVVLGFESPDVASSVDCEVAVKLGSIPEGSYLAGPLNVIFAGDAPSGRQQFGFFFNAPGSLVVDPTFYDSTGTAVIGGGKEVATLPIGTWTRLRLVVDLGKSPHSLFAYVDGTLKYETKVADTFKPGKVFVRIGAHYAGTPDGGTIDYDLDDARVSWK